MERVQRLVNRDYRVIKVVSGGIKIPPLFLSFFPISYPHLLFLSFCSPDCMVLILASVCHGHYLILLMTLEKKEVPMTTSDLVPLSLPLKF